MFCDVAKRCNITCKAKSQMFHRRCLIVKPGPNSFYLFTFSDFINTRFSQPSPFPFILHCHLDYITRKCSSVPYFVSSFSHYKIVYFTKSWASIFARFEIEEDNPGIKRVILVASARDQRQVAPSLLKSQVFRQLYPTRYVVE